MSNTFPSTTGSIPLTLEAAWAGARQAATQLNQQAIYLNAQIGSGNALRSDILANSCSFFATLNIQLTQFAAVPGLAAYAQVQVGSPTLDIVAAFTSMQSAVVAIITWIVTNFPHDVNGNLLYVQFNGQGQAQYASFPQSSLTQLVALLTALQATIS